MPALPVPTDTELEELARTLDTPEIPSKLRCGVCDLLAYDTMRLPCCSTNVCDKCYEKELGEECIICCHKPLDKALCEPNKPMRITIKALLKRKFNDRVKKQAEAVKIQQVRATKEEHIIPAKSVELEVLREEEKPASLVVNTESSAPADTTGDLKTTTTTELPAIADEPSSPLDDETEVEIITERFDNNEPQSYNNSNSNMNNGNFNGMNGITQMNGMLPMDFSSMLAANGMLPMAGLPNMMGMGMMPMMSQMSQMFGGFDNSNMGMNGMNMGMASGGSYQGQNQYSNGGSWMNNNQGNFNNNAYGNGNFGVATGYSMSTHQNNYNQMNEQSYANDDFHRGYGRQGFQNRRGRRGYYNGGGFGRGGYNMQGNNQYGNFNQEQLYPQQSDQTAQGELGITDDASASQNQDQKAALDESFAPGGEHDFDEELGHAKVESDKTKHEDKEVTSIDLGSKEPISQEVSGSAESKTTGDHNAIGTQGQDEPLRMPIENTADGSKVDDQGPRPIQAFVSDEPHSQYVTSLGPNVPTGPGSRGHSHVSSAPGQSPISVNPPTAPRGTGVIGAPTGPRALREGLPNTGRSSLKYGQTNKPTVIIPSAPANQTLKSPAGTPDHVQESTQARPLSRSRSRSLSPSNRGSRESKHIRSRSHSRDIEDDRHAERYCDSPRRYKTQVDDEEKPQDRRSRSSRHQHDNDVKEEHSSKRSNHRSRHHREVSRANEDEERYSNKGSRRVKDNDDHHLNEDNHRRSSKRSRRHHDEETDSSSHKRHRERSRSPGHRSSEKDKHRHREDQQEDVEGQTDSYDRPKQASKHSEYAEHYKEPSSRKRRTHGPGSIVEEEEYPERERKRSRHDHSPAPHPAKSTQSTHFSIRGSSKPSTPLTPHFAAPTGPSSQRSSNKTNGSSSQYTQPSKPIPTGPRASVVQRPAHPRHHHAEPRTSEPEAKPQIPEKDVHTLEREARDRERLQREMQRRAFVDVGSKKRTPALNNAAPAALSGRRLSYKYEDQGGVDARRVEREREGGRWH